MNKSCKTLLSKKIKKNIGEIPDKFYSKPQAIAVAYKQVEKKGCKFPRKTKGGSNANPERPSINIGDTRSPEISPSMVEALRQAERERIVNERQRALREAERERQRALTEALRRANSQNSELRANSSRRLFGNGLVFTNAPFRL